MNSLIVLNQNDNVGVSQFIIPEKTKIEGHNISTLDPIPFGSFSSEELFVTCN